MSHCLQIAKEQQQKIYISMNAALSFTILSSADYYIITASSGFNQTLACAFSAVEQYSGLKCHHVQLPFESSIYKPSMQENIQGTVCDGDSTENVVPLSHPFTSQPMRDFLPPSSSDSDKNLLPTRVKAKLG